MDLKSSHPFWPVNSGLLRTWPALRGDARGDVVIVGAGITGALMADKLSAAGMKVIVLDSRDAGHGSTSASTALLQYEIDTPLTELISLYGREKAEKAYRACWQSIDTLERIVRSFGDDDCGFSRRSSVYLASKAADLIDLEREWKARRAAGFNVSWWDAARIERNFSFRRPAALVSSQGAQVDAYRLTQRLLARAARRGAGIYDRTAVTEFHFTRRGVKFLTDRGGSVTAGHAVMATGYETQHFLPRDIVKLHSSFAFVTEPLDSFSGWWRRCLLWETARPYFYLRTTSDGRALVGGEDEPFRNPEKRDALIARKTASLARKFAGLFPGIPFEPAWAWAGTFGETADGLAYIGTLPKFPRCHFALGFGGNGITFSVTAAAMVRDALLGRKHECADVFHFGRKPPGRRPAR